MAFPRCIGVCDCINVLFIAPLPFCRLPCDLRFQGRAGEQAKYLLQGFNVADCSHIQIFLILRDSSDRNSFK